MVRSIVVLLVAIACSEAADTIQAFGLCWTVPITADWRVDGPVLELIVPRPSEHPRRPTQFAIADTPDYITVTIEAEMKREPAAVRNRRNSLMIASAYRDADHFNYAHLSVDSAE